MKIDIVMPKMGESVTEGTIIKWHKNPGDAVKKDEIIFEISTDKVDTEIPSPEAGVLSEVLVNEQETVAVGVVVARLATDAADAVVAAPAPAQPVSAPVEPKVEPAPVAVSESAPAASGSLIDIPMPKMGESVMEGTIIKWHKKPGDAVKLDETFFEISTDKVDTEITSPADGVVAEILVKEQETVAVGTIVARLAGSGALISAPAPEQVAAPAPVADEPLAMHDMVARNAAPAPEVVEGASPDKFFSPLVMNIARKEGVSVRELESINGSGVGGRVTKTDVLNYIASRSKPAQVPVAPKTAAPAVSTPQVSAPSTPPFTFSGGDVEITPMDNIRRKIMQHMVNSRDTSVHVTGLAEVDMSKIHRFIQANKDAVEKSEGVKLTYMAFISHAVIRALREYPLVNSTIDGNNIVTKKFVNLGIAVAVQPNGLIVPNIKNAQEKNIIGLAKSINDVALRARNKKLTPDDITNGTFSITNYGVFGTLFGTPIINQPEVAILGVGAVVKKPVVVEVDGIDTIAIKPMMYLTLSHDHRLVDGMLGGLFLKAIRENLENFDEKLIY